MLLNSATPIHDIFRIEHAEKTAAEFTIII